jgi:hypothetical protein
MDKAQILQNLFLFQQQYSVDTQDFVVITSGSLVLRELHGFDKANDIDIVMPDSVYNKLMQDYALEEVLQDCGVSCLQIDDLNIQIVKDAATYYCNTWMPCCSILCQHPYNTLQMKLRLNREKDQEHIAKLKTYLGL